MIFYFIILLRRNVDIIVYYNSVVTGVMCRLLHLISFRKILYDYLERKPAQHGVLVDMVLSIYNNLPHPPPPVSKMKAP